MESTLCQALGTVETEEVTGLALPLVMESLAVCAHRR